MGITEAEKKALIEDCKKEIEIIEKDLIGYPGHPALLSELRRQQIALSSLTAEPEYNISYEGGEVDLEVSKARYDACHPSCRWISYEVPPAQILRKVELPGLKICSSDCAGSQLWIESQVWNKAIDACTEALRQQGYEVKS